MTLQEFRKEVQARKLAAGVTDREIEAARNSGIRRTPEKRAFIARIQERAQAAGKTPLPANY
jgi:flagellum-specific peptidoglycan hydrolase FlgJ